MHGMRCRTASRLNAAVRPAARSARGASRAAPSKSSRLMKSMSSSAARVYVLRATPRASAHLAALSLGARRADRALHVLALLGRRQHRLHTERLYPQLARPALGVVQVLVFLVLDLVDRFLEGLLLLALQLAGALREQVPVQVV